MMEHEALISFALHDLYHTNTVIDVKNQVTQRIFNTNW